jgi:1,4-dihydroxy-2-naphthoyl-CoA hydrolase
VSAKVPQSIAEWNEAAAADLPGPLGRPLRNSNPTRWWPPLRLVQRSRLATAIGTPAAWVALTDSGCGYGTLRSRPAGASGFTSSERKRHFGFRREGVVVGIARPLHQGRTRQVWDATISRLGQAKPIAAFATGN